MDNEQQIQDRMDFADAALAVAGHQVTDADARAIMRRVAAGELTGDEAVAILKQNAVDGPSAGDSKKDTPGDRS